MLDDAILKRVVSDDADPAAGVGPANRRPQAAVEYVELVVDLDAQGLESLARRVSAAAPRGRGDSLLDHVHELEGGLDGGLLSGLHHLPCVA